LTRDVDLAIVGSGFGGSLMAMIAHQLGLSVILLERGKHPRMAIGESTTPLSNLLLERLSTTYELPQLAPLAKWGSWQRAYPQIACGLKPSPLLRITQTNCWWRRARMMVSRTRIGTGLRSITSWPKKLSASESTTATTLGSRPWT
jgi:choline dehydrogenase-like flavoprotein